MRSPSRKHEGRSEKEGVSFSHLWGGPEGHHGLPLLTPERLEQFGVLAEEMATIEIAAPVHYPPSPPGDIECFEFTQDDSEEEEEEVGTPIPTPKTPLPPPQPPAKRPDFGPEGLPTSFSFACGGWLQFYEFGVASCIKAHRLHVNAQFAGCSAGALAALGLAIEEGSYDKAVEYCKKVCIPECRGTFLGPFRLAEYVRGCLEDSAALENWQKAHNRLHVAVTSLPSCKSMRVSQFESKEDLITALLASAAAVPLAPPVKCKGQWLIDGGIADFQPVLDDATVTISPLYFSRADIKPSRYVPAWWAFLPPSNSATVDWLYDLGYCDCLRWMRSVSLDHHCGEQCRADKSDLLSCRQRPARQPHPFDVSTKSFMRFFGYGRWPRVFDWGTMVLVASVWRSLAYFLIYSELWLKLFVVTALALWDELCVLLPGLLVILALFLPSMLHTAMAWLLLVVTKLSTAGPRTLHNWKYSLELLASLFSISLFFRSLPVIGQRIHLRKHHKLFRQSLIYRVFLHII